MPSVNTFVGHLRQYIFCIVAMEFIYVTFLNKVWSTNRNWYVFSILLPTFESLTYDKTSVYFSGLLIRLFTCFIIENFTDNGVGSPIHNIWSIAETRQEGNKFQPWPSDMKVVKINWSKAWNKLRVMLASMQIGLQVLFFRKHILNCGRQKKGYDMIFTHCIPRWDLSSKNGYVDWW